MDYFHDMVFVGCFKDMGSQSVVEKPTLEAHRNKFRTYMVIEGKGGLRFLEKNFFPEIKQIAVPCKSPIVIDAKIDGGILSIIAGSDDFHTRPFSFNSEWFLREVFGDNRGIERQGVVLIGESSPINIERDMALSVAKINKSRHNPIKLVACQDFWGNSRNVAPDIKPDMAQVNDEYAAELTLETYKHLREKDVIVRGNPGVKNVVVSTGVQSEYNNLRKKFETVYFYAGGGEPETSEQLKILGGCISKTNGNFCVVVGFHPTLVEKHGVIWRDIIAPFNRQIIEAKPGTGDEWASLADVTISGHSTTMTTALYSGKSAISIRTPSIDKLYAERHMSMVPQVAMGWTKSIEAPVNLALVKRPSEEALEKLKPFDSELAFRSIVGLIE